MNLFKVRLLGYLCLGLSLGLGVPPWFQPDRKREYVTQPGVFLASLALSRDKLNEACGENPPVLDSRNLKAYPEMSKALRVLKGTHPGHKRVFFKSSEARALAERQGRLGTKLLCLSFEGGVYLLRIPHQGNPSQSSLAQVGASPMQAAAARPLSPGDFERGPFLKAYIVGLVNQAKTSAKREKRIKELRDKLSNNRGQKQASGLDHAAGALSDIKLKRKLYMERLAASRGRAASRPYYQEVRSPAAFQQWSPFLKGLGLSSGQGYVKTSDYLIRVSVRDYSEWVTTKLTSVSWARKILGALLFILGLWVMRRAYAPRRGMAINPRWVAVFADVVFVLAMGVLAAGPLDYGLERWLGLLPLMDQALQMTLCIMYLPSLFFLAWMAANLGGQSLEVDSTGVTWHGPVASRLLPWDHIRSLNLHNSYVMVSRVGLPIPRRLQTKLVFELINGQEQELFEPGARKRKQGLLAALAEYAPNRLHSDLRSIAEQW